ncbi:MAG: hypothetical protein HY901_04520 [Deltaproteobacteria bacterium]|nr:hypothetical protein [Deltaproteobacteria bacterium]
MPRVFAAVLSCSFAAALLASCSGHSGSGDSDSAIVVPTGPVTAPARTWTWVDFPDSACGNGQPTGLGVNLNEQSTDVFVYLQGGGACWDGLTCLAAKTTVNLESGYTEAQFASEPLKDTGPFERTDAANPFREASFVIIPYCTGDLHAGTRSGSYEAFGQSRVVHHHGAINVQAYLRRLVPTFPGTRKILLGGSSAGGYGAQLNYHRFVDAFPEAEIHVLADSSQLVQPWGGLLGKMQAAWAIEPPPGCTTCLNDMPSWAAFLATSWPTRRFALLAFDEDQTLSLYFGSPLDGSFKAATDALLATSYDPHAKSRYFVLPGSSHTMLGRFATLTGPGGLPLQTWVGQWVSGDPRWANAR